MSRPRMEFFCPYCSAWIMDSVHVQHHHQHGEHGQVDERRDWRVRVNGVVYDSEEDYFLGRARK